MQKKSSAVFKGIIEKEDQIDLIVCNPPFHASIEDAQKGSRRKIKNLSGERMKMPKLNFSGISNELVCKGGEHQFIQNMIDESKIFSKRCFWFSSLVSKQSNLKGIYKSLENSNIKQLKTITMGTANKYSRIVAWTFLSKEEQLCDFVEVSFLIEDGALILEALKLFPVSDCFGVHFALASRESVCPVAVSNVVCSTAEGVNSAHCMALLVW